VLVVHPSLPAKTALELVKYVKANPDKLTYASSGIGSPIHMTTELLQIATGTKMIHVPYKGMGAAYADLVGGRIRTDACARWRCRWANAHRRCPTRRPWPKPACPASWWSTGTV
jgi:hypothetical protein